MLTDAAWPRTTPLTERSSMAEQVGTPSPTEDEKRRAILMDYVVRQQAAGDDVVVDNGDEVVMKRGKRPNHVLHLILSLLTLGLWAIFVWLPIGLFGGEKRFVLRVDQTGQVKKTKG
jgi:hypothetical protein